MRSRVEGEPVIEFRDIGERFPFPTTRLHYGERRIFYWRIPHHALVFLRRERLVRL